MNDSARTLQPDNFNPSRIVVSYSSHGDVTEDSEFDQFEELTRRLLTVPKSEIDKARLAKKI